MPRLIENDFPYARLSAIAEAESWRKEVHRPVYYIHKWWARRLGSVFRGILLGSCLDEGEDFWKCFYGKNDFAETVIFDPFMGSGVTIGEAIKLGCTTLGQDINPVAYLTCRAAFTKYDPSEVVATYQLLEHTVAPKLLNYFETRTEEDSRATVLYYFLVKVVSCPRCDEQIDLFKSRIFSKNAVPRKDSSARALCPSCGAVNATLYNADYVKCSDCSTTYNPQQGSIKGAKVECDKCGHTFRLVERMKSRRGPLGYRRYAKMILTADGQKRYASMNAFDDALLENIAQEFTSISSSFPQIEIAPGYNTNPDRSVDIVVTDPPFFDNVHYSQLADFFFYWLNQLLDYSKVETTRRNDEVQDARALKSANISVSLGDAKVILMGRFLCAAHRLWDIDKEETFLADIERHIDDYVADVIKVQGEVLYTQDPSEQLVLFEEMANYLANKGEFGARR